MEIRVGGGNDKIENERVVSPFSPTHRFYDLESAVRAPISIFLRSRFFPSPPVQRRRAICPGAKIKTISPP